MSGVRTFLFAGGGTGGHIFPALAIAEQLRALQPGARTIVLCSDRPIDTQILRREKANHRIIPAKPFGVKPKALLRFAASWGAAIRAARQAIHQFQQDGSPVEMVAMGGFVSPPCAQAAVVSGVPLSMVNLDAVPGKANRWVARRAARVFTTTPVIGRAAERAKSWTLVPPVVRSAALPPGDAAHCRSLLGLAPERPTLLVTGASQGARSINRMLAHLVRTQPAAFTARGWQVIHQCGTGEEESLAAAYSGAGIPAVVKPFIDAMGPAWGAADLAVSRAGAGSVAEAWAAHVPAIFMPYPYHRDQHQRFNAEPLARSGGAVIATDYIDEGINATAADGAGRALLAMLADPSQIDTRRRAMQQLGPADGAARIASALLASPAGRGGRAG